MFDNAFKCIDSEFELNPVIQSSVMLAKPSEIVLGKTQNGKPATFSYVSISYVLKLVLNNEDDRCHILSQKNVAASDDMASYVDGDVFKIGHITFFDRVYSTQTS